MWKYLLLFAIIWTHASLKVILQEEPICRTEKCRRSAENLKSCMNQSVNPCDNFYQFACGNYKNRSAHENQGRNFFVEVKNRLTKRIKAIFFDAVHKKDPKALVKAKRLYTLCMDTDNMNAKGVGPLTELLRSVGVSQSPLSKLGKHFEWEKGAAKIQKIMNSNFLISVDVTPDPTNRSVNRISISKPSEFHPYGKNYMQSVRPDESSTSQRHRKLFEKLSDKESGEVGAEEDLLAVVKMIGRMTNFIVEVDSDLNRKSRKRRRRTRNELRTWRANTEWLTKFIIERIRIHYKVRPNDLPIPEAMTLEELQKFTDSKVDDCDGQSVIDWEKFINTYFEGSKVTINLNNGTDKIYVYDREYLSEVIPFIRDNHKRLEIALWWDIVSTLSIFTTNRLRNHKIEFELEAQNIQYSSSNSSNRTVYMEDVCTGVVQNYFGLAVVYGFSNDTKIDEDAFSVNQTLSHIKRGFLRIIEFMDWMDAETKTEAAKKINAMKSFVSQPPWLRNVTALDEYFESTKLFEKDFVKTILTIEQDMVMNTINSLYEYNDMNDDYSMYVYPLEVNAFYAPQYNIMVIPMGIINFPFYTHPIEALNYGALGSIIGHEVTHGLDTTGKRYGADGNLRKWWKNETLSEYRKQASCFVKSYNRIEIGDETVDGLQTLDENIADNGGLREALIAYRQFVEVNGTEPRLEGFENYTHEQLLILSFGNLWCEDSSEVSLADEHSPNEARVNGVLKNSKEFEDIWKCKKGTMMNPNESKCRIW